MNRAAGFSAIAAAHTGAGQGERPADCQRLVDEAELARVRRRGRTWQTVGKKIQTVIADDDLSF
jgi:hypothetical protein